MPGTRGKSGRKRKPGKLYQMYLRYRPGVDPLELKQLLDRIEKASGDERQRILRQALLGGLNQVERSAGPASVESAEATALLDAFLDDL